MLEVDYFQIAKTGVTGGAAKTLFEIGTVNGIADIILKGNFYADGFIQARHLSVQSIEAVTASITNLTAVNINSAYAMYNTGAYNANWYTYQFTKELSNSENLGGTYYTGALFSKTFSTNSGVLMMLADLTVYGEPSLVRFGNGNWGTGGPNYRVGLLINIKNSVGTVLKTFDLGNSSEALQPTIAASIQRLVIAPSSATITVEVIGRYIFSSYQNNTGNEMGVRAYFKATPSSIAIMVLEPYNMTAI